MSSYCKMNIPWTHILGEHKHQPKTMQEDPGVSELLLPLAWEVKTHSRVLKRSSTVWSIPCHFYHFSAAGLLWQQHIFLKWAVEPGIYENLFESSDLKPIRSSCSYFYWFLKMKFASGILPTEETVTSIREKPIIIYKFGVIV